MSSRTSPCARLRRSPFPTGMDETWYGDAVVLSNAGDLVPPTWGYAVAALLGISLGPLLALLLGILAGATDFARVMGIFAFICIPLAIYVWFASRRFWRMAARVNRGEYDQVRRLLGVKKDITFGPLIGLLAQLRGDHEAAVRAFGWTMDTLDPTSPLPAITLQSMAAEKGAELAASRPVNQPTFLRAALSLANVGRLDDARAALGAAEAPGAYCAVLGWVASSYLAVCSGDRVFPGGRTEADAAEALFRPIRGAWGGLALTAFGLHQLGDADAARMLVAEELARPGAEFLPSVFPRLEAFLHQVGAAAP